MLLDLLRDPSTRKLALFAILVSLFCVTELAIGVAVNSLVLLTDAFHMISDLVTIVVGIVAVKMAKKQADAEYTYGWGRAEIVGGLLNGCVLLAVCVFILLEAIHRFIAVEAISQPLYVVAVGCIGLAMNLVGLAFFHGHGHSHGHGHGHVHGHGHGHGHGHKSASLPFSRDKGKSGNAYSLVSQSDESDDTAAPGDEESAQEQDVDQCQNHEGSSPRSADPKAKVRNTNLHAIFLHVLGDCLGSAGVIASGLLENFLTWDFRYYFDPAISILIAGVILWTCVPLVRRCISVLLQRAPSHVNAAFTKQAILKVPGVEKILQFHIWELSDTKTVGTVVVRVNESLSSLAAATSLVAKAMASSGIHLTTVQVEPQPPMDDSDL